jgi:hypothetical protein
MMRPCLLPFSVVTKAIWRFIFIFFKIIFFRFLSFSDSMLALNGIVSTLLGAF